ncbi:hypothetical protein CRV24_010451 [Beauveria bassiana]|nr:hypothetical protein CRV24_010451 [Beauveria bassiana]KAH8713598.1 hypothetical protein HC256_006726 [Beauveria bassiana]
MEFFGNWGTVCHDTQFNDHLTRGGFPSVPDPLQTIVSQATQIGSDLDTEATHVKDQASSLVSSATEAAD